MINPIINKIEVALFPKNFASNTDFNSLLEEIKKEIPIFNGGFNVVVPAPPDAPPQIPRLLLRSKDNSIGCNVSVDKFNIFWLNSTEKPNFNVPIQIVQKFIENFSTIMLNHTPSKTIKRVGYIKDIFIPSDSTVNDIEDKIIVKEKVEALRDFNLQLTYNLRLEEIAIPCNNFVTIANTVVNKTGGKVIVISKDINTIPTEDVNWGIQEINKFIKSADAQSEKTEIYKAFLI